MGNPSDLCKECATYKSQKEKCWFYWDHKSACTQFRETDLDDPKYEELKE